MRIALVFQACNRAGGVERIVWEATRHLSVHHEVTVVAREAEDLPAGVRHLVVPPSSLPRPLAPISFRRRAAAAVAGSGAEVTVVYGAQCPPGDVYVINSVHRAWLRRAGATEIRGRTVPGWFRYLLPHNLVGLALERSYYAHAHGRQLVPCAQQVATDLAEIYGLASNPVTVVHNGFSPDEFSPERRSQLRAGAREALGYGADDIVVVMAANEWRRKGLTVLLEAMAMIDDPRIHLLLVGRTDPKEFTDQIRDPALRRRVRYLGGSDDVAVQHAAGDLFVMPTQYEAFSLAIIEALASGLPVVTTTVPGAGDAVIDGVNGLLLDDPFDPVALASLLTRGLDHEARQRWSAAAPGSVGSYSWDRLMADFESVLLATASVGRVD